MIDVKTVLCPVDLSPLSERALALAVAVCEKLCARLVLEHNLDARPPNYLGVTWMWSEDHEADEKEKAAAATERIRELLNGIPDTIEREARVTRGPLDAALLHLAQELPAELMVMGSHGPSSGEHKSLTERVIIQAPCSVLTLGERFDPVGVMSALGGTPPERLNVLIPVDFTSRTHEALHYGAELAERMPHHLRLVHVVAGGQTAERAVEAKRQELTSLVPTALSDRASVDVRSGDVTAEILDAARASEAIFILMAAHGKSAFKRFLFGTTTMGILHGSECPVLFVPPHRRKVA